MINYDDGLICFLDTFCKINPTEIDLAFMSTIISHPTFRNPEEYGIWERLVTYQFGKFCPNSITRSIRYYVSQEAATPLINMRVIFFKMMGDEPGVQRIIKEQLTRHQDNERLEFFEKVYVPFAQSATTALLDQPFESWNIKRLFHAYVVLLQLCWLTQSTSTCNLHLQFEKKAEEESQYIIEKNKQIKQEKKAKRRENQKKRQKLRRQGAIKPAPQPTALKRERKT